MGSDVEGEKEECEKEEKKRGRKRKKSLVKREEKSIGNEKN